MPAPKRGEVWNVRFHPAVGAEIQKVRPAVVISMDSVGRLPLKIVVPITDWKPAFAGSPGSFTCPRRRTMGLSRIPAPTPFRSSPSPKPDFSICSANSPPVSLTMFLDANGASAKIGAPYSASSSTIDFISGLDVQRIVYVSRGFRATWTCRLACPSSSHAYVTRTGRKPPMGSR